MKITIYTITDCQFSKQEKEYLQQHNLPYEEKNLEQNREWLAEMLTISNNFAGTPVTKIEKDDGKIEILKGFTKEEFDQVLGFEEKVPAPAEAAATIEPPTPPPPPTLPVNETQSPSSPPQAPMSTPNPPSPTQPTTPPSAFPTNDDSLNSILNDLQSKSTETQSSPASANPPTTPPTPQNTNTPPNIPEPDFK